MIFQPEPEPVAVPVPEIQGRDPGPLAGAVDRGRDPGPLAGTVGRDRNPGAGTDTEDFVSELQTNPAGFEVDDIFAFETGGGNQGLIRIMEVNEGSSVGESTIKYNVKIEK